MSTPVTFNRRLRQLQLGELVETCAVAFVDEIDTFVTVDDGDERRDLWPTVSSLLHRNVPVVGLTGTNLTESQIERWRGLGFGHLRADVPSGWLPHTTVRFRGVLDPRISEADAAIRSQLREQYGLLVAKGLGTKWREVKNQAALGDSTCRRILTLHTERLRLFETSDPHSPKGDAILEWADANSPCLIMCRYRDIAQSVSEMIRGRLSIERADGSMSRPDIGAATEWFRSLRGGKHSSLVITRELGGRGLDFPMAASACLVSPRSNHQAVAQEFARIRSRMSDPKEVLVLYFQKTEEEAKARRLADRLKRERYADNHLFTVVDAPAGRFDLEWFESRNLRNEEAL